MAGDGASTTTTTQGGEAGQQGAAEATTQQGFDPAAIDQQFQTIGQGQEELRQLVSQLAERIPEPQQEEVGQEPEPIDLTQFLDPDPGVDPEQQARQLQELLDRRVEQRVQEIVGPLQERFDGFASEVEMERLVAEFPVLGENPQAAQEVVQVAHALAEANGWGPQVANSAQFWRLNTLAAIGARALQDEGQQQEGAGDGAQALEGAGGAMPGVSGVDLGQQIVEGPRKGSQVLPF